MNRGLNKVMIIGNLGHDPEMRYTPSGRPVTTFSVAASRSWNTADGERHTDTEWFNVVTWGNLAEICKQYLTKGQQVYVEGRLQTRSWEDKDGQKRYTTELVANQVTSLQPRTREDGIPEPGGAPREARGGAPSAPGGGDEFGSSDLDELPF